MKNKHDNRTISKVKQKGDNGTYISEVQEFDPPEGYEDAFHKYYPKEDTKNK